MWKFLLSTEALLIYSCFSFGVARTGWAVAMLWNLNLGLWLLHRLVIYPRYLSPLKTLPEPKVFYTRASHYFTGLI
jgi:hypothetical protein